MRVVCSGPVRACYRPAPEGAGFHFVQARRPCRFGLPLEYAGLERHDHTEKRLFVYNILFPPVWQVIVCLVHCAVRRRA